MKYKYLDHTADVMFEAYGNSLNRLFENCALATEGTMIDLKEINPNVIKKVELKNQNVETLLYDFLSELVYFKDAELLLFSRIKVEVTKNKIYNLKAVLHGEKLNEKHSQKVDVKAVTFHKFEIKKRAKDYIARVILDI